MRNDARIDRALTWIAVVMGIVLPAIALAYIFYTRL